MLVAAGNINVPYQVIGIVHAMISQAPKSPGFGQPKQLPILDAYDNALASLVNSAKKSGGDGLIHVNYEHRVAIQKAGCGGDKTEQVFELFAWGTAIKLSPDQN